MLRGFQQEAERSTDSGGKDKRYGLVLPIVMMMILLCSVGNAQVSHTIALPQVYIDQQ